MIDSVNASGRNSFFSLFILIFFLFVPSSPPPPGQGDLAALLDGAPVAPRAIPDVHEHARAHSGDGQGRGFTDVLRSALAKITVDGGAV